MKLQWIGLIDNSTNKVLLQNLESVIARWKEAQALIKKEGLTLRFPGGAQIHPAVKIAQASEREIRLIVRALAFEKPDGSKALMDEINEVLNGSKN